jgi:hypothetical protein
MPINPIDQIDGVASQSWELYQQAQLIFDRRKTRERLALETLVALAEEITRQPGDTRAGHQFHFAGADTRLTYDPIKDTFSARLFDAGFGGSQVPHARFGYGIEIDSYQQSILRYWGAASADNPGIHETIVSQFVIWLQNMRMHYQQSDWLR